MRAHKGDRLVIHAHHIGEPDRCAEVIEVSGPAGGPPYLLRWDDDGHESLYFPGPDAQIEHLRHVGSRPNR